jgi:hypothetical protein
MSTPHISETTASSSGNSLKNWYSVQLVSFLKRCYDLVFFTGLFAKLRKELQQLVSCWTKPLSLCSATSTWLQHAKSYCILRQVSRSQTLEKSSDNAVHRKDIVMKSSHLKEQVGNWRSSSTSYVLIERRDCSSSPAKLQSLFPLAC